MLEGLVDIQRTSLNQLNGAEREKLDAFIGTIVARQHRIRTEHLYARVNETAPSSKFPSNPERYVHNLSSIILDRISYEVLSLGHKSCLPVRHSPRTELEVQFQCLFSQLSDLIRESPIDLERLKATLVSSCYQYLQCKTPARRHLSESSYCGLKSLQRNNDILITKPDKGSGVVIMDRSDYLDKMQRILNDNTKFQHKTREKDKTSVIERKISKELSELKQRGVIDSKLFENLKPTGSNIPRLYGLPKIHKDGIPLRPILDMVTSPYHTVAKWLNKIIDPIRREMTTGFAVRDTFDFVDSITDLNIGEDSMFSLDVSSLFTNVPLRETIDYLCEYIENKQINIPIPLRDLKKTTVYVH